MGQQAPTPRPAEGGPEFAGYQVFTAKGCTQCHTIDASRRLGIEPRPDEAFSGPDLTHFLARSVFAGAVLPRRAGRDSQAWLANPPR